MLEAKLGGQHQGQHLLNRNQENCLPGTKGEICFQSNEKKTDGNLFLGEAHDELSASKLETRGRCQSKKNNDD